MIPLDLERKSKFKFDASKNKCYDKSKSKFEELILKFDYLQLSELKTLFEAGALKSATVHENPMLNGYNVHFEGKTKDLTYIFRAQREDEQRIFKSIDAAIANAKKVGFKTIKVIVS